MRRHACIYAPTFQTRPAAVSCDFTCICDDNYVSIFAYEYTSKY